MTSTESTSKPLIWLDLALACQKLKVSIIILLCIYLHTYLVLIYTVNVYQIVKKYVAYFYFLASLNRIHMQECYTYIQNR